ncbi:EAL domain-containing protein [Pseudoduganella sp. FT25W]|jgi:diguanylate cyclase (GGDEF)-like protein/PAS domain S-box-containing protein|uniref:Diguanylate cyclase DosC n=1 Tax=Duganella alba TaxID=2666081 RepID=A0A6L5QA49_9BURK|nr:EAL domain-containing protein [Duganella alba]MRX06585.1 EAL domain-containing protein [Duganella alba]MRX18065.1 EAL domain-containing protein [Duganella alba]
MLADPSELDRIATNMMPADAEIQQRLLFLEVTAEDIRLLRQIHPLLQPRLPEVIAAFYRHLQTMPVLRILLKDKSVLDRLHQLQGIYFETLTAGDYGPGYVRHRLRVGLAHQRIGLAPEWYIGAYRKYLADLGPLLQELLQDRPAQFLPTYNALMKVASFDMGLALDTYIKASRQQLRESEARFRGAFGQAAVGLAQLSADGRWLRANRKLLDIVGYTEEELRGMHVSDLVTPEDWQIDAPLLRALAEGELETSSREKRYLCKDGRRIWVKATVTAMQPDGSHASLVAVVEDISQRKQYEEELMHLARHDALTGLANRTLLLDRVSQAIAQARRSGNQVAMLFLDLDRFKTINDSLGHDAGDRVVVEVGRRLKQAVRDADTVARFGGDEFVVLLPELPTEDIAAALAQKILNALFEPMLIHGHELAPACSVGISLYPRDGADGKILLKNADAALYQAKAMGRGNYQFYSEEMNARTLDRLTLESGLRHAVERGELQLKYQPQIDLASGDIIGAEALLRWHPAGQHLIMPDAFISIAEETGLIVPIGEWVLRTACAQQVAWRRAGLPDLRVAVNLSARQFRQPGLDAMVARVLADTGCPPGRLELEITESVLMDRPDAAAQTLQRLSDMGVQLAIDDFGTGYSSLSYLKRFPINALKIDRSFVRDIAVHSAADNDDGAIASAVIALAHSMGLTVVAEGVETPRQHDFLRELHCDQAQGFYFSEPMSALALEHLFIKGEASK